MSLPRRPEPELMDEPAQARAYSEADFSEPHDAFVAHFRKHFPAFGGGRVLDLGCGPADVTVRFARAHPQCEIVGVDGSRAMLELGGTRIAGEGLGGRIKLERRRLPDEKIERDFRAVISNSLLHHLADPAVLWSTVTQAAKPGAAVLVMDLMRPASASQWNRLVATYAGDAPEVLHRDFANSLLAAYTPDEVRAQLTAAGLGGLRVEIASDRHFIVFGRVK